MTNSTFQRLLLLCLVSLGLTPGLQAQLVVTPATAQELVDQLQGQGVQILNPQLTQTSQNVNTAGVFQLQEDNFDFDEGVLLTTGRISAAVGPNNSTSKSFVNLGPGDPTLTFISGYQTTDACKLEFDIIPAGDSLRFNFSFASEEYNEYACTQYNDVFAFILSGVTDPLSVNGNYGEPNRKNLALIPGTNEAVTINNINGGNPNQATSCPPSNTQFFYQNPISPISTLQYDGWTRTLTAFADSLVPCNTYHLELIIADASDRLWDSGVFIERISSNEVVVDVSTEGGNNVMYEGCNDATITFCYDFPVDSDREVTYQLIGTAQNGVDYDQIGTGGADDFFTVTILEGELCAEVDINTIVDGIDEGLETMQVVVFNPNPSCDDTSPIIDTETVFISDRLELYVDGDSLLCLGESTTLDADSGGTSFTWTASPSLAFSPDNDSVPVSITPDQTTVVTLTSTIASCVATETITIQVSDMQLLFDITGETCQDACDGAIDLTVANGIAPFDIVWLGPDGQEFSTDEDLSGLCQGQYDVRVIDAAGCVTEGSAIVGLGTGIDINASLIEYNGGFNISCNGACDAILSVVVNGTDDFTITYSSPGDPDPDINNLCPGPITINVTDNVAGCSEEITLNVTEPDPKEIVIVDLQPVPCLGSQDGCATVSCTGGSGNVVSYVWTSGGSIVGNGAEFCGPAGQYTVTATDDNGCSDAIQVSFTEPATGLVAEVVSQMDVSCAGANDGAVCVQGVGGSGNYTYEWVSPALGTGDCQTGLAGGPYVVEVTDEGGCTVSLTVLIDEPSALEVLLLSENDIQCEGQSCGSALVVGTGGAGGYTYNWMPVGCPGITGFPLTSPSALFCEPCEYMVTVTDQNGCVATRTLDIEIISSAFDLDIEITDVSCAGESTGAIDLEVTGGLGDLSYEWVGGNCNQGPIFTQDLTDVCSGLWCLTVTDENGCEADTCVTIQEPAPLNYFFEMTPTLCADNCTGSIDFVPVGGTPFTQGEPYTYAWQGPVEIGGDFTGEPVFSTDQDIVDLCKGSYQITLSDSLGCTFVRRITVTAPDDMLVTATNVSDYNGFQISCPGACDGFIVVETTGGTPLTGGDYESTWIEQGIPFNASGLSLDSIGGLCASVDTVCYEIIKEDSNGCIQNTFVCLNEPDEFSFDATSTPVTCSGDTDGSITIDIEGGVPPYNITITDSVPTVVFDVVGSLNGIETVTDLSEGWYFISVSDQNGCTGLDSVLIDTPNPILVTLMSVPFGPGFGVSCDGDCNGAVFTTVQGGTPFAGGQYDHTWWDTACDVDSISSEPFLLDDLCIGDYFVTVTDSLGCSVCPSTGITLTAPTDISDVNTTVTDVSCFGDEDGLIDLLLSGGSGNYTVIDWTPSPPAVDGTTLQPNLSPGQYSVLVADDLGCDTLFTYQIDEPDSLFGVATSPFVNGFNISCADACDGTIQLDIFGGTGEVDVFWSGPAPIGGTSDTTYTNVCAGTYTYTLQDENGCTFTGSITLTQPEPIVAQISALQAISCVGDCNGQLQVTGVVGGSGGYTYLWSTGGTAPLTQDTLCGGPYSVTITDNTDCSRTFGFNLDEPEEISSNCIVNAISCFGVNDGSISCFPSGGTPPFTCTWTGPGGFTADTPSISDLGPGEYCKTTVDANLCEVTECFTLIEPTPIEVEVTVNEFDGGFGVSCAGACDGSYGVVVTGGSGVVTITPPMEDWDELCAGTYTVTVTDESGCEFITDVEITEGEPLDVSVTSPTFPCGTNINCLGGMTGTIEGAIVGGDPDSYTYYWIDVLAMDTFLVSTTAEDIDGLSAGEYALYVEDANGCNGTASITLTEPDEAFEVDYTFSVFPSGDNISCGGVADGQAFPVATGACGTIDYFFQHESLGSLPIDGLAGGSYVIQAIDDSECTSTFEVTLTEPDTLLVSALVDSIFCFGDTTGRVCFDIVGGSPELDVVWTGPSPLDGDNCANALPAGDYNLMVTDFNNCMSITEINLSQPDSLGLLLQADINQQGFEVSEFGGNDGRILAIAAGGTPFDEEPYIINWTGPIDDIPQELDVDGLIAGQYCLTIIDASGCSRTRCIELREPDDLRLPNGISPNGDGINDGLEIPGLDNYASNVLKVFNRWGNVVFEQKDYNNGDQWKGEGNSGGFVTDGTYFVILQVTGFDGSNEELNGYLEVRR